MDTSKIKKFIVFVILCIVVVTALPALIYPVIVNGIDAAKLELPSRVSFVIDSSGKMTAQELTVFFMDRNPDGNEEKVRYLAECYVAEGAAEGINSDIAFVQMCLETGYLRFGGLVTEEMNNFCGLGAIDREHPGNSFETVELGVRAHIQHLHAYGTERDLVNECIDNRYKYVKPRGKAPTVFGLAGTWASDRQYGEKLRKLLTILSSFQ